MAGVDAGLAVQRLAQRGGLAQRQHIAFQHRGWRGRLCCHGQPCHRGAQHACQQQLLQQRAQFDPVPSAGPAAAAAAEAGAPRSDAPVLNEVTVKASGLGLTSADMSTPATVLEGDVLTLRRHRAAPSHR